MSILKQHAIKHYGGLEANLPARLPYGDTYFTTDTNKLFKYNQDSLPKEISGSDSEASLLSSTGYSHTGAFAGQTFG